MNVFLFSCPTVIDPPAPVCSADKETLFRTNAYCGLIREQSGVFSSCFNDASIWSVTTIYMESCMYDTCANQNNMTAAKEVACGSLEVLAADCASKGHVISWRQAANCRKYMYF